jgi:multiple sugar transport system permease protein
MDITHEQQEQFPTRTSADRKRSRRMHARPVRAFLTYAVLIVSALLFLIPFYIIVRNALMTSPEITSFTWNWWTKSPQWVNFSTLFNDLAAPMGTGLMNSVIIAVTETAGQLLFASMAGYALARIPSRWSKPLFFMIILTLMIPGAVTVVPKYLIVDQLGWVSTLQGIIVPELFNAFTCFIFRQFCLNFPTELEDAGRVDGLGYFGIYWRIVLPNAVPILVALGVISFIGSWNSFLWPLVVGQDQSSWTVQVVLSTFLTAQTINLPELFMGVAVAVLPLVVVFLFLQRYIAEGIARTGING